MESEGVRLNRRQLAVVALGILGVLVVVAFLRTSKHEPAPSPGASAPDETQTTPGWPRLGLTPVDPSSAAAQAAAAASTAPAEPAPVIDEITFEKPEVCSGEENLVTIKAHTTNGTDDFLHYVIDGQMGQASAVRLWRDDGGAITGKHFVTVFGRGNVATSVPLPEYEVKDCRPHYIIGIDARLRANTSADFDLNAKIIGVQRPLTEADKQRGAPKPPPGPKPFKAVSYAWSFGDGQSVTTLGPLVEHSYEARPQNALYAYYVIGVDVRGAQGEHESGRTTLALINPAFEELKTKGRVVIMASLDSRFPQLGSDGKVTQHVRLWHAQPGPVTVEHAAMTKYFVGASGETNPEEVDVAAVLGTTTIPAGHEGITTTVVLDTQAEPDTFAITYALTGTSAEGYPAAGSFSVMKPPARPGPDAGTVVQIHCSSRRSQGARDARHGHGDAGGPLAPRARGRLRQPEGYAGAGRRRPGGSEGSGPEGRLSIDVEPAPVRAAMARILAAISMAIAVVIAAASCRHSRPGARRVSPSATARMARRARSRARVATTAPSSAPTTMQRAQSPAATGAPPRARTPGCAAPAVAGRAPSRASTCPARARQPSGTGATRTARGPRRATSHAPAGATSTARAGTAGPGARPAPRAR